MNLRQCVCEVANAKGEGCYRAADTQDGFCGPCAGGNHAHPGAPARALATSTTNPVDRLARFIHENFPSEVDDQRHPCDIAIIILERALRPESRNAAPDLVREYNARVGDRKQDGDAETVEGGARESVPQGQPGPGVESQPALQG